MEGFADGVVIRRTLIVETSAAEDESIATVSITNSTFELDDVAFDPSGLDWHVLDTAPGSPAGSWSPSRREYWRVRVHYRR